VRRSVNRYERSAASEFEKIGIALQYTDHGFLYFTTSSAEEQKEAAERIMGQVDSRPIASFDCALEKPFRGFRFINRLIEEHPALEILFYTIFIISPPLLQIHW